MPSEIAGTSMGAIIGACIALKMPIERIITFLKDINYLKLIDLNFPNSLVS